MRRRRLDPFDRRSAALSGAMHVAIVLLAWLSTLYAPEPIQFISYEIELVSPPPALQAEEPEPAAEIWFSGASCDRTLASGLDSSFPLFPVVFRSLALLAAQNLRGQNWIEGSDPCLDSYSPPLEFDLG